MIHHWLILLAFAVGIAFLADKLRQPYPTLLVVAGLFIGLVPLEYLDDIRTYVASDEVFRTAVILIFLSALLGEASLKLPFNELKSNKRPIALLALAGTLLTFLFVSALSFWLLGLSLQESIVFGSLMAATDPVSVLSIFKSMGLNKKLSIIVEGESLANDGVAVVLFKIAAVTTAISVAGITEGAGEFIKVVLGGLVIGMICGFVASRITARIDNYLVETGLSLLLFYGAFELAEHYHFSGVIAVVSSGLLLGTYGRKKGMSDLTAEKMDSFWEIVAFVANALIFLMVGIEVSNIDFSDKWAIIAGSIVIVILARFAAIYASLVFERSVSRNWLPVIGWGGLKGSLSIALALSLSPSFPGRDLILAMTFGNVLFSLLIQGSTVKMLVGRLGIR